MSDKEDKCKIGSCKDEVAMYYYGHAVCQKHWDKYSQLDSAKIKKELGIKEQK